VSFTNFCSREKVSVKPAQASLRWILGSPEVSTVVMGVNSLSELEEDLATLGEEGRVDEKVLSGCLDTAQSSRGKEKLEELVRDPAIDIRSYAKRAIESGSKA
jgi:predicted aldo/keto reductase-like oxidoreductase